MSDTISQAFYLQRDRKGNVIGRELLDVEVLSPLVDVQGKQPEPSYPAWLYQGQTFTKNEIEVIYEEN